MVGLSGGEPIVGLLDEVEESIVERLLLQRLTEGTEGILLADLKLEKLLAATLLDARLTSENLR